MPQAAVAGRGEGLRPAGEADGADDGVHLPGAVRGHPAAGVRAAACRELLRLRLRLEVLCWHRCRRPGGGASAENQPATERVAHCGIRCTAVEALRSLPMTVFSLSGARGGEAAARGFARSAAEPRARNLTRGCSLVRGLARCRGGCAGDGGFGLAAARAAARRLASGLASAGASSTGSRGTILKTASALIAVSTGAVTGGVSDTLARLLNSTTPTVVTSAAGTSW